MAANRGADRRAHIGEIPARDLRRRPRGGRVPGRGRRLAGYVIVESTAPYLLFEPPLPVSDLLAPSDTRTFCAYKGEASYLSLASSADVAWFYPAPLREAAEVTGRIAFFNEHVDITVDGTALGRPQTPWSRR